MELTDGEPRRTPVGRKLSNAKGKGREMKSKPSPARRTYRKRKPVGQQISADIAYSQEEFLALTGLGKSGLRKALRDGLVSAVVGNKRYIRGQAWLDYLQQKQTAVR